MRQKLSPRKTSALRKLTGLPVNAVLVRGGTDHRQDLLLDDGTVVYRYKNGSLRATDVRWIPTPLIEHNPSDVYWDCVHRDDMVHQGEVNGRWVVEVRASTVALGRYPAGTLVCEPADETDCEGTTFTAENGRWYKSTPCGCRFTPRSNT